ncbi:unnamed protein product, partial [Allacma fusca]
SKLLVDVHEGDFPHYSFLRLELAWNYLQVQHLQFFSKI